MTRSRPSTRPSGSRARRSSAFVREQHAPVDSYISTCPALTNRGNSSTSWKGRPTDAHRDRDRPRGGIGAGGFAPAQHEKHGDAAKVKSLLVQDVSEKVDGKE